MVTLEQSTAAAPLQSPFERLNAGFLDYLTRRGVPHKLDDDSNKAISAGLERINEATHGVPIYKANVFRYFHDPAPLPEVVTNAAGNAEYFCALMGPELFRVHPYNPKRRNTFYKAPIDKDFYLGLKGGSGSGTFCLDLSIGLEKGQNERPSFELWKLGLDTGTAADGSRTARMIRTGSAMRTSSPEYSEKVSGYDSFRKRYKIEPKRALAFVALFAAHEMPGIGSIQAITFDGVRSSQVTQLKTRRTINFDYTHFFTKCGFAPSDNQNWLQISNSPEGFYNAVVTNPDGQSGLRNYEVSGLEVAISAFRELKCVRTGSPVPLTVAHNTSPTELAAAMPAYRQMFNR